LFFVASFYSKEHNLGVSFLFGSKMMDLLDRYKIQVSFDTVHFLLDKKTFPINENGLANLKRSILFLESITKSIYSISAPKSEEKT
jgi:hypothetical protein